MIDRRRFYLDGRSCGEFGVVCSGSGTFDAPERDVEETEIPGRSGNLITDSGRFNNITVTYPCFIHRDFAKNMEALRAWLLSDGGYRRLEDGYDTEHFRLAQYAGGLSPEVAPLARGGTFDVVFNCQPQRWLYSGEIPLIAGNGQAVRNPTPFTALPRITVTGTGAGTLTVGGTTVSLNSMPRGAVVLDSDTQNAYYGAYNLNSTISAPEFPTLPAGETVVRWTGGITGVEIIPRWWTL